MSYYFFRFFSLVIVYRMCTCQSVHARQQIYMHHHHVFLSEAQPLFTNKNSIIIYIDLDMTCCKINWERNDASLFTHSIFQFNTQMLYKYSSALQSYLTRDLPCANKWYLVSSSRQWVCCNNAYSIVYLLSFSVPL